MAKRRNSEDMSGSTFADLYDIQEELNRQTAKPLGRPRKKVKRDPTTIYLTKTEKTILRRLDLLMGDHLSINRSEIVGIAIELLSEIIAEHDDDGTLLEGVRSPDDIKKRLKVLLNP